MVFRLLGPPSNSTRWRRYGTAALAGLLLAMAYPKWNLSVLAWVAPAILLATGMGRPGGKAFRCGYVGGFVFHLTGLYWLCKIPVPVAPIVGWVALSAYLALYQGVWVWLSLRLYDRVFAPSTSGTFWERFLSNRWPRQLGWYLTCAALWVAGEMVQARLFSGFPWNLLGVSQYSLVPLIQISSITGVYGISFLVVWLSVAMLSAAAMVVMRPSRSRDWMIEIMPPLFAIALVTAYGMRQVFYAPTEERAGLRATLIQPSVPQTVIWDADQSEARFQDLLALTRRALTNETDLLIWPEGATPGLFRYETNISSVILGLVREYGVHLVFNSEDIRWDDPPTDGSDPTYRNFNASFLLDPNGRLLSLYYKRKLVVFGEYVPLARLLPFLRDFTSVHGDFSPGLKAADYYLPTYDMHATVLICFEDTFANLTRDTLRELSARDAGGRAPPGRKVDFLINLTNDGWFGDSAAQWQHAANAVFRAVENHIPMVRCANNGLTCVVDEWGRMHHTYLPGTRDIYGTGFKNVIIPFRHGGPERTTFYQRWGDLFGWGCVAWGLLLGIWAVIGPRRRHGWPPTPNRWADALGP